VTGSAVRYLVSAGQLESGSWYLNDELEGSRFAGEGGHFIDTLGWWVDSQPAEVFAVPGTERDDVQVTVRFESGAVGTISYFTAGNSRYPKETLDATGGSRTARFDNFRRATVWSGRRTTDLRARGGQDKGQRHQVSEFVEACRAGSPMPISLASLLATTRATIAVGGSLVSGKPERV
jgi:predicted dehydrogenase